MSTRLEKIDELREEAQKESKMRNDYEYFLDNSHSYEMLVLQLERMKSLCELFEHDLDDVIKSALDEI